MSVLTPQFRELNPDLTPWDEAKAVIGSERVTLGPVASHSWLNQPEHLAFQLARYRVAAALIGDADRVVEIGCGEGLGAGILAKGRSWYLGLDSDAKAIQIARLIHGEAEQFMAVDALRFHDSAARAIVSLDVIEHIPAADEESFMDNAIRMLPPQGIMVVGTPNAAFDHLASPQSKAGHINTFTHDRLYALMSQYFGLVQSFGMQDTSIHLGHPQARHYLLMAGFGPWKVS